MENKYKYEKLIILGSGQLAHRCAEIAKGYLEQVEVLELKVTDSTILEKLCSKSQIPYSCVQKQELTERLQAEAASTLVVSAGNTYLFPAAIIEKPNFTIINWHNALLPRHRGRNAEVWAIYAGDTRTGVTWHYMVEAVDAGRIICQETIPIDEKITAMQLYKKQSDLGSQLFGNFIEALLLGQCEGYEQPEAETEELHYSREIPNNGYLDLNWDIRQISRFLRSMDYGSLLLMGRMYVVYEGQKYSFYRYKIRITEEAGVAAHEGKGGTGMQLCKEKSPRTDTCSLEWQGGNLVLHEGNTEIILRELQEEA